MQDRVAARAAIVLIALLIVAARGAGAELAFAMDLAGGAEQRLALGPLAAAGSLELTYHRDQPSRVRRSTAALELVLVTSDQRYFSLAEPFDADDGDGDGELPLDAPPTGAHPAACSGRTRWPRCAR